MQDKESSLYMSQNVNYGLQNTQLELAKEYEKKNISAKKELYVYQEKEKIKEINRELKKAQYENIFVGIDGNLYAQTYNTSVQSFPRYIANFQNPELCILHCIAHKEDIIYCFKCTINEKQKSLFF